MIAVVCQGQERKWSCRQYGEWMVYTLPRRVTQKAKRSIQADGLLAGCRYYLPTPESAFLADSPLSPLDAEEYRLLRLPDAAVAAARRLHLPPARCPAQVIAPTVNHCCQKTLIALAGCCRDVTLVTDDRQRAQMLASQLLRRCGLPLRLADRPDLLARGVICSLADKKSLRGGLAGEGRIYVAQDLFEVDFTPPFVSKRPPIELAGALYAATRADWLRSLVVTRILPLDK